MKAEGFQDVRILEMVSRQGINASDTRFGGRSRIGGRKVRRHYFSSMSFGSLLRMYLSYSIQYTIPSQ